jgi:exoribonuclease R
VCVCVCVCARADHYISMESNNMIEEFMLLANERVARKVRVCALYLLCARVRHVASVTPQISAAFPTHALLRQHDAPKERPIAAFCEFVQSTVGVTSTNALCSAVHVCAPRLTFTPPHAQSTHPRRCRCR